MRVVTARIEEKTFEGLEYLRKAGHADQASLLRRLLDKAVLAEKVELSLRLLREGRATLRKAAEMAGLPYSEMLLEAEKAGVELGFTPSDVEDAFAKASR